MDIAFIVLAIFTYEAGSQGYQSLLKSFIVTFTLAAAVAGTFSAIVNISKPPTPSHKEFNR